VRLNHELERTGFESKISYTNRCWEYWRMIQGRFVWAAGSLKDTKQCTRHATVAKPQT